MANSIIIEIAYPGSVISCNHYKYRGGIYTKPEARAFMVELGWLIKQYHIEDWEPPLRVKCDGRFSNRRRCPDLHNLLKIICDSIEEVTGINDKYFKTETGDAVIDKNAEPMLWITISDAKAIAHRNVFRSSAKPTV